MPCMVDSGGPGELRRAFWNRIYRLATDNNANDFDWRRLNNWFVARLSVCKVTRTCQFRRIRDLSDQRLLTGWNVGFSFLREDVASLTAKRRRRRDRVLCLVGVSVFIIVPAVVVNFAVVVIGIVCVDPIFFVLAHADLVAIVFGRRYVDAGRMVRLSVVTPEKRVGRGCKRRTQIALEITVRLSVLCNACGCEETQHELPPSLGASEIGSPFACTVDW